MFVRLVCCIVQPLSLEELLRKKKEQQEQEAKVSSFARVWGGWEADRSQAEQRLTESAGGAVS